MTVGAVRINADGTIVAHEWKGRAIGDFTKEHDGAVEVISLHHPMVWGGPLHVGFVGGWSATDPHAELNRSAWALYGGSPVFGPMLVVNDDGSDLDDELVAELTANAHLTADITAAQDAFIEAHG